VHEEQLDCAKANWNHRYRHHPDEFARILTADKRNRVSRLSTMRDRTDVNCAIVQDALEITQSFLRYTEFRQALIINTANDPLLSAFLETHSLHYPIMSHSQHQVSSNVTRLQPHAPATSEELFIVPNMKFKDCFLYGWNSGNNIRSYENFCRIWRQTKGLDQYYRTNKFTTENPRELIDKILVGAKAMNYQIMFTGEKYTWFMKFDEDRDVPVIYAEVELGENTIDVCGEGDKEEVLAYMEMIKSMVPPAGVRVDTLYGFSQNGPLLKTDYLYRDRIDIAKPHYYPWLKAATGMDLDEFFQDYLASRHPVLLLIGPPGTGKSTFLRTMISLGLRVNNYISTDSNVILSEFFNPWMSVLPNNSLIAIEDADTLVSRRDDGNNSMSGILNNAQGIISNNNKIVVSTNLKSLHKVDEALIRPGRSYKVLEFSELTVAQAHEIREIDGLPPVDFGDNTSLTLAEVLNWVDRRDLESRQRPGIGFKTNA